MVKTLYKAVPDQSKELNPVQPQYNTTPNKYGKTKKNITKSNGTIEYKGFNNAVNALRTNCEHPMANVCRDYLSHLH